MKPENRIERIINERGSIEAENAMRWAGTFLREQGVGSSNLPAPTNSISSLQFGMLEPVQGIGQDTMIYAGAA